MDPQILVLMGLVLAAGCLLQSSVGFGLGLLATPLLLLLGLEPEQIIPLIGVCAPAQLLVSLLHHRQHLAWRRVLPWIAAAVAAQPIGVLILARITTLEGSVVRPIFGGLVLAALAVQALAGAQPRRQLRPAWGYVAMPVAGLMSGMAGMPGPPVVLWAMAHDWPAHRLRATIWTIFLGLAPTSLLFLFWKFGQVAWSSALLGVAYLPAVLLGTLPGLWLAARVRRSLARKLAFTLLACAGVAAILAGGPGGG